MSNSLLPAVIAVSVVAGLALVALLSYVLYRRQTRRSRRGGMLEDKPGWMQRLGKHSGYKEIQRSMSPASFVSPYLSEKELMQIELEEQSRLLQSPPLALSPPPSLPPLVPNRYTEPKPEQDRRHASSDSRHLRLPCIFSPKRSSSNDFTLPISAPQPSLRSEQPRSVLPALFSRVSPSASRHTPLSSHAKNSRQPSVYTPRRPSVRQGSFLSISSESELYRSTAFLPSVAESNLEYQLAVDELSIPEFNTSPTSPWKRWLPNVVNRDLPFQSPDAGYVLPISMPVPVPVRPPPHVLPDSPVLEVHSFTAFHSTPELSRADKESRMSFGATVHSAYPSSSSANSQMHSRPLPLPSF